MGLEGLSAAKAFMISVVVIGIVMASIFLVTEDFADNPLINKSVPEEFNDTYDKVSEMNGLTENMSNVILSSDTSDSNALSTMLSAGYNLLRLFPIMVGFVSSMIKETWALLGLPGQILVGVLLIITIVVLFIIVRSIFSAGGGS